MTNPTLSLSATTRSATSTTSAASATKPADDVASSSAPRFDAAMEAARAHARASAASDAHRATSSANAASGKDKAAPADRQKKDDTSAADEATAAKAPVTKDAKKADDDTAKKDDGKDSGDDTSIASSVLALIGVPPKAADLAAKALKGATALATGNVAGAIGALVPGAGGDAQATGAAGAGDALAALTGSTAAATGAAAVSPLATLVAAQGLDGTTKDDASLKDMTGLSPMPYSHAQAAAVDGAAVQVQATQAVASPQFAQELGEQIAWMGSGDVKEARIKLHPEELGSMDVRVNMDGGKVNVAIIAQHPAAVHAVQQTLSQLDTLLAHHGLSLGQTSIGQGNAGQAGNGNGSGNGSAQGDTGPRDAAADSAVLATSRVSRGLVDEVA